MQGDALAGRVRFPTHWAAMGRITVFLADDSAIIRAGVSAMLGRDEDVQVVGFAEDYDSLVAGAEAANPDVIVSDIRMPPHFESEGIDACKEIRKRHPGTGVVILSQYDDPEYAVSLLAEGSAGYAYLLKDRIAEGDQLGRAIREVATGGSMLDPVIVSALLNPVRRTGGLSAEDDELLEMVGAGRTIKSIASLLHTSPAVIDDRVERLFVKLAEGVSSGQAGAIDRLRRLHRAIVEREEQGESLSRLLPTGVAEQLIAGGRAVGESERLDVTIVMSDVRGYTSIAEHADPTVLAQQLNRHRAEMNRSAVRARARPQHGNRGGGVARQRRAGRVHARGRRRQPLPAPPAVRPAGRDRAERGDVEHSDHHTGSVRGTRGTARQGPRYARYCVSSTGCRTARTTAV